MGRGVLSSQDPLCVDPVTGHILWGRADVVLAIGTRLQMQLMQWGQDSDLKVVRVEADPEALDKIAAPAVGLVGDAAPILRSLLAELPAHTTRHERRDEIEEARGRAWQKLSTLTPQIALLGAIRAELPEDGIFVDELTQLGYASRALFPVYAPRTFLSPGYQGTLGWGMAAALGAQVAKPGTKVVSVIGDGGFLFNAQELATAVQHRIPLVTVLANDNAFGNVRRIQDDQYGGRRIASDLRNPDFVRLADSFGALALRASGPDELRTALRRAFREDGPTVIEVPVGPMPDPWTMLRYRSSRVARPA
jgi:acetolactate synthase-1/2/3 large subunit